MLPVKNAHVIGVGNIGTLVAVGLSTHVQPPAITLLLPSPSHFAEFDKFGRKLSLSSPINKAQIETSYPAEFLAEQKWWSGNSSEDLRSPATSTIANLIVTVKATRTAEAIESVRHRLSSESTILFLQNGMGITEEVSKRVFPDQNERPKYLIGIASHGVYHKQRFSVVHVGFGSIQIGSMHDSGIDSSLEARSDLLELFEQSPILNAARLSSNRLQKAQLEKLVANAVINPLTALFDCRNGDLTKQPTLQGLLHDLVEEVGNVIRAFPELMDSISAETYSTVRLLSFVSEVIEKTALNRSSMLQDMKAGLETEINYINGYIVKRGKELGISCPINKLLLQMVISKQQLTAARLMREGDSNS